MAILSLKSEDNVVLNDADKTASTNTDNLFEIEAEAPKASNKSRKSPLKPNTYGDLVGQLGELCTKRKDWEENAYKTSNDGLYSILAQCLHIYQQMRGRNSEQVKQRKKLSVALEDAGFICTEGTPLATKIVRYVFRTDRKRSHVYSRVIISADEHKQDSVSLPKWITQNGGIEEIRRKSTDGISPSDLNKAYKNVAENKLFSATELVASFKPVKELEASDEGNSYFAIALLRKNEDGTSSIVYGSNTASLINLVLIEAGKKLSSKQTIVNKENERRKRKQERSAVLDQVA